MTPTEFLKTIYLGDRSCKSILIDGWDARIMLQVDVISRIRNTSGNWDFYNTEDIPDGWLVFSGVQNIRWNPSGPIPNDLINEINVTDCRELRSGNNIYVFSLSIGSVTDAAELTEVTIEIQAEGIHLEDPRRPGDKISF
jgi:hypothetical protein